MALRRRFAVVIFIIILGAMLGSAFGQIIGKILPKGPVKSFFLSSVPVGFKTVHVDLSVFTFDVGFMLRLNIISIVGMILLAYLLRWVY
ncbi:MAG: DUF4321 domain-containing protein [bacterium]